MKFSINFTLSYSPHLHARANALQKNPHAKLILIFNLLAFVIVNVSGFVFTYVACCSVHRSELSAQPCRNVEKSEYFIRLYCTK